MGVDFSHLRSQSYRPDVVARIVADGERVTDEVLLEIISRITPPLFGNRETAVIVALLSRKRGRRPCRGVPSLRWLSKQIASLDRSDVDPAFLKALSERIASPVSYTEFERSRRHFLDHRRPKRDVLVRGLYHQIYGLLEGDIPAVHHQILGELRVPLKIKGRSARAAEMTREALKSRLGELPPATSTIIKIASMIQ